MQIDYTVQVWREDGQFIAHAMPLDVASSGPTPEAARKAVDEAVRLFLATAAEHGTLTEVLEDAGYRRVRREWRGPAWLGFEQRSCLAEVQPRPCPSSPRSIGARWKPCSSPPDFNSSGNRAATVPM